jgi:hypothetical protein
MLVSSAGKGLARSAFCAFANGTHGGVDVDKEGREVLGDVGNLCQMVDGASARCGDRGD